LTLLELLKLANHLHLRQVGINNSLQAGFPSCHRYPGHAQLRGRLKRLHQDLIFCYKVVFGLVGVNTDDFFEFNHAANTNANTD